MPDQKVVFEAHECFTLGNKALYNMEKEILKKADFVFSHNISTLNELRKFFGLQIANSAVVYNGCKQDYDFKKKDFDFSSINYYGSFLLWKGLDLMLDFALKTSIKLELYGKNSGNSFITLKNTLKERKIEDLVCFKGQLPQNEVVKSLIENNTILIIPSVKSDYSLYSTPLKLFEYMANSNVVLAPNFPPVAEIVKDGENGFLYEAGDEKSLEEKFDYIKTLSNEELNKISKNAYKSMNENTWKNRAIKIIKELEKIN